MAPAQGIWWQKARSSLHRAPSTLQPHEMELPRLRKQLPTGKQHGRVLPAPHPGCCTLPGPSCLWMELTSTFISTVVNLQPDHQGSWGLNVQEINQILLQLNINSLLLDYLVLSPSSSSVSQERRGCWHPGVTENVKHHFSFKQCNSTHNINHHLHEPGGLAEIWAPFWSVIASSHTDYCSKVQGRTHIPGSAGWVQIVLLPKSLLITCLNPVSKDTWENRYLLWAARRDCPGCATFVSPKVSDSPSFCSQQPPQGKPLSAGTALYKTLTSCWYTPQHTAYGTCRNCTECRTAYLNTASCCTFPTASIVCKCVITRQRARGRFSSQAEQT